MHRERVVASKSSALQVGSCAKAHKEVLDLCWVCDSCPLKGLPCKSHEEKNDEEEKDAEATEIEDYDMDYLAKLPCERLPEDGFMWTFNSSKGEWKQLAKDGLNRRYQLTGFSNHEAYCFAFAGVELVTLTAASWNLCSPRQQRRKDGVHETPAGRGFMWQQDGSAWKQVA